MSHLAVLPQRCGPVERYVRFRPIADVPLGCKKDRMNGRKYVNEVARHERCQKGVSGAS